MYQFFLDLLRSIKHFKSSTDSHLSVNHRKPFNTSTAKYQRFYNIITKIF